MSLTIHSETDDQRQLKLTVEVAESRVEKAMRQAARKLSKEINMPGFRRGKVPYPVILHRVGRDSLRAEAIDDLLQPVFDEVIKEIDNDIYAQPSLDDMEIEPLVLKFTVPLTPEIKLGEYRALRKEIDLIEVTEEAVDEMLEHIQSQHQVLEPADRPIAAGDLIAVSGQGIILPKDEKEKTESEEEDGEEETAVAPTEETLFDEERLELVMDREKLFVGTEFVDQLIGLSVGDEKSFAITFPDDFEDEEMQGRQAQFNLSILDVKNREVPKLDDELAKQHGDFETLAELRENTRENLLKQAESEARNDLIEGMVDDLLEDAVLVYSPAAIKLEIDDMVESFKNQVMQSGWEWEDFVQIQGNTEESIRDDFRESAAERLERRLVLQQFIVDEMVTVDADDIDASIEERVSKYDNEQLKESIGNYYRSGYGFEMVSSEILMDKVHERIQAVYTGTAPDLAELEALAAAADNEEEE